MHFIVEDIAAEVEGSRAAGVTFRNEIISGPGGQQIGARRPFRQPDRALQPASTSGPIHGQPAPGSGALAVRTRPVRGPW